MMGASAVLIVLVMKLLALSLVRSASFSLSCVAVFAAVVTEASPICLPKFVVKTGGLLLSDVRVIPEIINSFHC